MAKVIKLTDNNNNTLLPVTDASYIQMKVGDDVRSVKDVIIENEEITALALNDLHSTKQEKLISGVTIKTINDESLIGAGDINLPEVYDVRFVFTPNGWVCNHTYSEITTAFNDGKLIVGMVGTNGNSPRIDGYNVSFGPLGFGNITNIPDYCFLTAVRQTAVSPYALFSMIMEYSSTERILISFKLDSNDTITVHAEAIGGSGQATAIAGGATNQIAYQTAANTTGFIDAPTTDGTVLKYDSRNDKFVWGTDNNTDVNVKITGTSTNSNYPLVFQYNTSASSTSGTTSGLRADSVATTAYFNPGKDTLYTKYSYSTAFTENGTTLDNKYETKLKYKLVNVTSISNMEPNYVYVIGSGPSGTTPNWSQKTSLTISSLNTTGYGTMTFSGSITTCPSDNSLVPVYQVMWKAGSSMSLTLPPAVRWKDNYAPSSAEMANKYCELTIMNNIATINIISA